MTAKQREVELVAKHICNVGRRPVGHDESCMKLARWMLRREAKAEKRGRVTGLTDGAGEGYSQGYGKGRWDADDGTQAEWERCAKQVAAAELRKLARWARRWRLTGEAYKAADEAERRADRLEGK